MIPMIRLCQNGNGSSKLDAKAADPKHMVNRSTLWKVVVKEEDGDI